MTSLHNLIGVDTSRLIRPRRMAIGVAILCLTPLILAAEWASNSPIGPL